MTCRDVLAGSAPEGAESPIIAIPRRPRTRRWWTAGLAGALLITAVACSPDDPPPSPERRAPAQAEPSAEPTAEARLHEAALRGRIDEVRELLAAGASVEARNRAGTTVLMAAAIGGHPEVARLLLESGAEVSATRKGGSTAVSLALDRSHKHGQAAVALLLLDHGAEIAGLPGEESFLLDAIRARRWELAEALLEAGAPAAGFEDRERLLELVRAEEISLLKAILSESRVDGPAIKLCLAIWENDVELLDGLLGQGLENERCEQSLPLAVAAAGGNLDALERLVRHGADLDRVGKDGLTPLMQAAKYDQPAAARRLLELGADPNRQGLVPGKGVRGSPLTEAAERESFAVVDLLLAAGADPNLADEAGGTALFAALWSDRRKMVEHLMANGAGFEGASAESRQGALVEAACNRDIVAHLLSVGADPSIPDRQGELALVAAAGCSGALDSVRLLLDAGADVDRFDATGRTALMTAAKYAGGPVVDYLVERGASLELIDERGWTALTIAAGDRKTTDATEALVRLGANLEHRDAEGATPLMRAAERAFLDQVRVLVTAGARLDPRDSQGRTAAVYFRNRANPNPAPRELETRQGTLRFTNYWFTGCTTDHPQFAQDQLARCYRDRPAFAPELRLFTAPLRADPETYLMALHPRARLVELPKPEAGGSWPAIRTEGELCADCVLVSTLVRAGGRDYRLEVVGAEDLVIELEWALATVAQSVERENG